MPSALPLLEPRTFIDHIHDRSAVARASDLRAQQSYYDELASSAPARAPRARRYHMTSPWQHIPSMRIISQKWRIRHTHSIMRRTHPLLRNCRDNAKLACHCTARYKIEWIYMRSKVRGPDSLELALEMRKKKE